MWISGLNMMMLFMSIFEIKRIRKMYTEQHLLSVNSLLAEIYLI